MKRNAVEAIKMYENGEIRILSVKQEQIRQRLKRAYHLLFEKQSIVSVANTLMEEDQDLSSRSGAFRAVQQAMQIYGNPLESTKEAMRFVYAEKQNELYEILMKQIAERRESKQDVKIEVDIASKILERNIKLLRLDSEDQDLPDPTVFQRTSVAILNVTQDLQEEYGHIMDIPVEVVDFKENEIDEDDE
ncbi:hypothetical protein [Flammeovirga pacifica]|uniref:Uncharacterized protein n=1 Tax=Flammeovirga pacifica TaxID=915059 RepID=A0A1S1Z265_FLAPC|nr:hypothetical protein [Flammeovirga pacifica]OHX67369.1 hypothetical protein NH26_13960 [Flammeovirga pacifica]